MDDNVQEICGYNIDITTNIVVNGTKPVEERYYHSSQLPDDIKCWDEENQRYINVELFSPVIYDLDNPMPKYDKRWEVYDNPNIKRKKIIRINYPKWYLKWWYEQRKRCIEGYSVGGVDIDGDLYWYLNFWRIKTKKRGKGMIPPRFLDLDKQFFDLINQARREGKNILALKRRQIGFSEKLAALAAKEYLLYPSSQTLIIAGLEEYCLNTLKKTKLGINAMSPNSQENSAREFYKRSLKDIPEYVRSGFKVGMDVSKGYFSEIYAITTKDNSQAANGKSPTLVIMEESGINPLLIPVYNQVLPSIQEMGKQDGKIVIFIGTGGEMKKGVADMMKLFYKPHEYNLLAVENEHEEEGFNNSYVSPFFPAWKYYVMDYDGNSYKEPGIHLILEERKKRGSNKEDLHDFKTQMPLTPREAFSVSGASPFNIDRIENQLHRLLSDDWHEKEQRGFFKEIINEQGVKEGVEWIPAPLGMEDALDANGDLLYPCIIFEHPTRPDPEDMTHFRYEYGMRKYTGLYGAGTDSYDKDKAKTSDSQGSFVVMKGYLNASTTSMTPVCRITWRPERKEKFYQQTALACIYYGECENLIEWSNIAIFDWYKANNYDQLLKERPDITYAAIKNSVVNNRYGVDQNTKHVWIEHFAEYILDYCDNVYDIEALNRFRVFRSHDHNCDITISYMLAWEGILDDVKKGYVPKDVENNRTKNRAPIIGFAKVNGRTIRL